MPCVEGLVIGKFMPPHLGHQYLINYAKARVDHLTVIIFTKSAEPIPGHLRAGWLRELNPDVQVMHVADEHPVDFQSNAVWQLWIDSIRKVYPIGPDLVFSSEGYGEELACRLGAQHVFVDPARKQVSVSGTLIRKKSLAYWDYMAPCVRAYFVRRVAILGAESTGKTTLAEDLAKRFKTIWAPEFARGYLLARGGVCKLEDMLPIARGQAASEDGLAREANRVLICDTELLTTSIWHERYWGWCPDEIRQLAAERAPRYALYLLCDSHVPWVDDGLRDSRDHREWFQQRFVQELNERQLPYVVLAGAYEARTAVAIQAVEAVLGA